MHIGDMIKLSVIMHKENPQNRKKKKQGEITGRESERKKIVMVTKSGLFFS
jgi:hypothetical protein